jgi:hypothetical protein
VLILIVLLIGGVLGWIVRQAHIQCDAVAAIKHAGGSVKYDWEYVSGGNPWAPRWLVEWLGVDFFGHVTEVYLTGTSITDAGLAHLKGLTNLYVLLLDDTRVTDAGLVHLKGLTKLSYLFLKGTQVSDAGLLHLKGLRRLHVLDLRGADITATSPNHSTKLSPTSASASRRSRTLERMSSSGHYPASRSTFATESERPVGRATGNNRFSRAKVRSSVSALRNHPRHAGGLRGSGS